MVAKTDYFGLQSKNLPLALVQFLAMTTTPSDREGKSKPWEDKNGATDVDGFLKAFEKDNNTFWRMDSGHALNVIEELIDRLSSKSTQISELKAEVENIAICTCCARKFYAPRDRVDIPCPYCSRHLKLECEIKELKECLGKVVTTLKFIEDWFDERADVEVVNGKYKGNEEMYCLGEVREALTTAQRLIEERK